MSKILVVEDDEELAPIIRDWLSFERHVVDLVHTGSEGAERLLLSAYDLIILDWDLPDLTGVDILRTFRANGGMTPILFLTGKRAIENKVEVFESGADDYLTKPFHGKELTVRVQALLRRPQQMTAEILRHGDMELDSDGLCVRRNDEEIKLVPTEFALLQFLMRHPKKLFAAEELVRRVWKGDSTVEALTTCIKRIRKKLDREGHPSVIRNVHGVGYGLSQTQDL